MREPSRRRRQRILAAAFEQGIRHFDVARMYGLGAAEAELGRFARCQRDQLVIATKFGIEPSGASGRLGRLQGPARAVLARCPPLRARVKRRSAAFHQPRSYDVESARRSLERSLRELGTDHVDLYFLHGPAADDAIDLPGLCAYLEDARRAGSLRAWGLAGEYDACLEISRSLPEQTVLQVRYDVFARSAAPTAALGAPITFGVLGDPLQRISAHLAGSPAVRARWAQEIGSDCADSRTLASLLLREALSANRRGVVLYSTTRPSRLAGIDSVVRDARESAPALNSLRRLVDHELRAAGTGGR